MFKELRNILLLVCIPFYNVSGQWGTTQTGLQTGVTNINLPAGDGSNPSYTFISSAYSQEPVYSGLVDAINGSVLTLDGFTGTELEETPWEDNELTQTPHLLRLVDGNADGNADVFSTINGHVFNVLGHVGNDVTINLPPDQMATYFTLYDSVQIIKATTLETLFGVGDDFTGNSGTPSIGDNILIWSSVGWKVYFHYNNKWQTFGTRADQKTTIIYPDEGMVYVRRDQALTLSFSGYVPLSVQSYVPLSDHKFLMSNPFPVARNLSELIDTSTNWATSGNVNAADQLLFWTGTVWSIYYNNGTDWIESSSGQLDDRLVEAGASFMILRSNDQTLTEGYNKLDL